MKILTSILLSLTLAFAGCGTLGKPDPGLVQFVAQDVGFLGAQAALSYNGSYRAELELTRQALQAYVAAGTGNVTNLQAILQQHIPSNFGTNGSLFIGNTGIIVYDGLGAIVRKIDKGQWVDTYAQPIAQGLLAGISQALGEPSSRLDMPTKKAMAKLRPIDKSTLTNSAFPQTYWLTWDYEDTNDIRFELDRANQPTGPFAYWTNVAEKSVLMPTGQPQQFFIVRASNTVTRLASDWSM